MVNTLMKTKKIAIVILSVVGMILSVWLSYQKLNGSISSLVGCGAASGCENILGSKWSVVFEWVPVSLFSALLYFILMLSVIAWLPKSSLISKTAAWIIIFSAVWFTALQIVVFADFCVYCMTMHVVGVIVALLVLLLHRSAAKSEFGALPLVAGFLAVFILAVTQLLGVEPDTHQLDQMNYAQKKVDKSNGGLHKILLPSQRKVLIEEVPSIGNKDSKHVIVEYFDYTCASCRSMNTQLKEAMKRQEGKYALIPLTVPLNPDCNPYFKKRLKEHNSACFLSHYSITVWYANPEKFAEYHDWLFQMPTPSVEEAKIKAIELVGEKSFIENLRNPAVRAQMENNLKDYAVVSKSNPVMPKLLLGEGKVTHGRAKDSETLNELLEKELIAQP